MSKRPIIIAGFGRSGTTWLSDILSKAIGGLILFEPFHPCVFKESSSLCYTTEINNENRIRAHIEKVFSELPDHPWLIRNHLKEPIHEISKSYIEYIWKNSDIIGFKTVRTNHVLFDLYKIFDAQVVLIHRHPLAVVSSILKRSNFWNEFGWSWHIEYFFSRSLNRSSFSTTQIEQIEIIKSHAESVEELIAIMWCISFIISQRQVGLCSGISLSYEDLYLSPFSVVRKLLKSLNFSDSKLHPSYLFTPSLTTLKTFHLDREFSGLKKKDLNKLFWESNLCPQRVARIMKSLNSLFELDPESRNLASDYGYLSV